MILGRYSYFLKFSIFSANFFYHHLILQLSFPSFATLYPHQLSSDLFFVLYDLTCCPLTSSSGWRMCRTPWRGCRRKRSSRPAPVRLWSSKRKQHKCNRDSLFKFQIFRRQSFGVLGPSCSIQFQLLTGGLFGLFFVYVLYSTLLHLPLLRFHFVGGC